jgi:hypothetical protein
MRKIFLLFLIFACLNVIAQEKNTRIINGQRANYPAGKTKIETNFSGDTLMVYDFTLIQSGLNPILNYIKTYKNTPYYENKWFSSTIFTEEGKKVKGLAAYNLETNSLYFSSNVGEEAIELKPDEFILNGKKFKKFKDTYGFTGDVYYEQLVHGEIEIFKQYFCTLNPTINNGYYPSMNGFDGEFEKENRYFTIYANKMTRIENNYKVFGLFGPQAKAYAKKENLKLSRENDLIKIANYLNELFDKAEVALN